MPTAERPAQIRDVLSSEKDFLLEHIGRYAVNAVRVIGAVTTCENIGIGRPGEFVNDNASFYFDPESALARAAEANISDAIPLATVQPQPFTSPRI